MKNILLLKNTINNTSTKKIDFMINDLNSKVNLLSLSTPNNIKKKGYSIVKVNNKVIRSIEDIKCDDILNIDLYKGNVDAKIITNIEGK